MISKKNEVLEKIKYEYGYLGEEEVTGQSNNPRFAYYFWKKDNGTIVDGKMIIRRYKGEDLTVSSISSQLRDGSLVYTEYFKAGVIAYDERRDEHFVLFHPEYPHITDLKKIGPYLLIGTDGEGLAIINVETFHLKRYREYESISKLEVLGSKIRIYRMDDVTEEIDLPNF